MTNPTKTNPNNIDYNEYFINNTLYSSQGATETYQIKITKDNQSQLFNHLSQSLHIFLTFMEKFQQYVSKDSGAFLSYISRNTEIKQEEGIFEVIITVEDED